MNITTIASNFSIPKSCFYHTDGYSVGMVDTDTDLGWILSYMNLGQFVYEFGVRVTVLRSYKYVTRVTINVSNIYEFDCHHVWGLNCHIWVISYLYLRPLIRVWGKHVFGVQQQRQLQSGMMLKWKLYIIYTKDNVI